MSVINKMLRDLDARRSGGALPELQRQGGSELLLGTVSVGARGPAARASRRWLLILVLLAVAAGAAWLVLHEEPELAPLSVVAPAPALVPAASAPAMVASQALAAASAPLPAASSPVPAAVLSASPAKPVAAPEAAARRVEPVARAAAPSPRPAPAPARPAVTASAPVPAPAGGASAAVAANAVAAPVAPRRLAAAQETVAQAQTLWAGGSREAAVELLREAVQLAERSPPPDAAVLAMLAREQARLELALGRPAAVLDLLTRLEPALAGQADLWAVRGNAAQRLGRHAESVQAYQRALQLRPGEPRWLLGAAVSLAAQGQLEAAAQQAEQARVLGPVSPEVLNYLRQAGVPLR